MSYNDCFGAEGLASAISPDCAGPPDASGVFIGTAGCCCGEDDGPVLLVLLAVAAPNSAARRSAVGGLTPPVLVFRSREQRYRAVSEGNWA